MDEKSVTGNLNMLDFRASPLSDIAVIRPSELNGLLRIGKYFATFGDRSAYRLLLGSACREYRDA